MFRLTIKTPNTEVFTGEVQKVHFASEAGEMEVLADHASITASFVYSPIEVESAAASTSYLARQGLFFFDNEKNTGTFLCGFCQKKSEIDHKSAQEYSEYIDKMLAEGHDLSDFQILYLKDERFAVTKQLESLEK